MGLDEVVEGVLGQILDVARRGQRCQAYQAEGCISHCDGDVLVEGETERGRGTDWDGRGCRTAAQAILSK